MSGIQIIGQAEKPCWDVQSDCFFRFLKIVRGKILFFSLCLSFILSTVACVRAPWSKNRKSPSIVVFLVADLTFDDLSCEDSGGEETESGFNEMCREAVRFNHAYAPSSLIDLSIASFLGGEPVHSIKFCEECGYSLHESQRTLAEAALDSGYRTYFSSSGRGAMRRQGIDQGFLQFEDGFDQLDRKVTPMSEMIEKLSPFILESSEPTLSVMYMNHLLYPSHKSKNEQGLERAQTRESQIDELDEVMAKFVSDLKKEKRWDETIVMIAGLPGAKKSERDDLAGVSGRSIYTRVPLLIKNVLLQKRDEPLKWRVDRYVSLYDISQRLLEFVRLNSSQSGFTQDPLRKFLQPSPAADVQNILFISNYWTVDTGKTIKSHFIRSQQNLISLQEPAYYFNSLVDPNETQPLYTFSTESWNFKEKWSEALGASLNDGLSDYDERRLYAGSKLFSKRLNPVEAAQLGENDITFGHWYLKFCLQNKDESCLQRVVPQSGDPSLISVWETQSNSPQASLKAKKRQRVKRDQPEPCVRALFSEKFRPQLCTSVEDLDIYSVLMGPKNEKSQALRARVIHQTARRMILDEDFETNMRWGWIMRPYKNRPYTYDYLDLAGLLPRYTESVAHIKKSSIEKFSPQLP